MNEPIHFRIGGVPEHFNYPWRLVQEKQLLATKTYQFTWQDYPGGTGAMCQALREGALDVALILTEGAVADIVKGNPSRIVGTYVSSPLTWGIHVHADSKFEKVADLERGHFAISRYQSGSHLMAIVNAQQRDWNPDELSFELVQNFEGARVALRESKADAFMWEKFTTKPTVDRGEWRRVGVCQTPWPCFVIVAREEILEKHHSSLLQLIDDIQKHLDYLEKDEKIAYIAQHYQLDVPDVEEWYEQTEWLCQPQIDQEALEKVQNMLHELKIIDQKVSPESLCSAYTQLTQRSLSTVMYNWRVESVHKSLALQGKAEGPLQIEDLTNLGHLDQYHYLGEQTCQDVIAALNLQAGAYVCDIGSGVGGTSRVLAHCTGCRVLGIEVQAELNELAQELTERVGLSHLVEYITTDFLSYQVASTFDHFVSLLVFLHFSNRQAALAKSYELLRPGGTFIIEDLVALNPFELSEANDLMEIVSAPSVTPVDTYQKDLEAVGFEDIQIVPRTAVWQDWTKHRYQDFVAEADKNRDFFGEKIYENRARFYQTIAELFQGGNLGGARILGKKPA